MSEVQSRPSAPRGRGSARGGRGGFSSRGGRGGRPNATNGDKSEPAIIQDDGEVGQLKKKYGSKVSTIKEMFPDWTDEDVVFALQETDGDLETTVERITDGSITQWGEVSKIKKSKAKDAVPNAFGDAGKVARGGRSGADAGRGRGRGAERSRGGRGGGRTASVAHTNGSRKETTVPSTTEPSAWETVATPAEAKPSSGEESWGSTTAAPSNGVVAAVASSIIPEGVKKSWASMFSAAPVPKKAPEPVEKPVEPTKSEEPIEPPTVAPEEPIPEPVAETKIETPVESPAVDEPEATITPSKDALTETNLEQVPDVSAPAPVATAASTAASSWDARNTSAGTPYAGLTQEQRGGAVRPPPASGFQATAQKATGSAARTPSFQRRILDQEEAVRMPGNREVDRAAVQFGAFNLNGSGDEDVDGDREEPETRAQPPQHSPVTQPRASLPPAPQQQPAAAPETLPTPKQATGLPASAPTPAAAPGLPSPQTLPGAPSAQQGPPLSRYGYGNPGVQESSLPPKPFDAFSSQAPSTQSPFEGYQNPQAHSQPQQQSGAFSTAPNDYSSYSYSDPQQRAAYNSYYQQYGVQPGAQGQHEGSGPQRSYSGYGGPQAEGATSQFPHSAAQQGPSRFATAGEGQTSGHSTPNPVAHAQPQGASQASQPQPGHPQQPQGGNYPYGGAHPYYNSPYYQHYMNQQYQQYGAGNYGASPYASKGGQQGYPGYGMTPGAPYEQASSPAAGAFGGSSLQGRDANALGGALSDYGRTGSAQTSQTPQALGGAFGGSHDAFGRGSSYQSQNPQHYASQGSQPGASDDLKPFGEAKAANGPSPSLSQAGRPGSATNTTSGSALPPPQSQQGGYGAYPGHVQQGQHGLHGNQAGGQYGAAGGASGHQAAGPGQGHQNSQYGGYQGFGGNYYGSGQQQQQRGWGGNYGH